MFNYWEPTHYLNHGYGLQTWEYSPEYAIRSWFYSAIHAGVIAISKPFTASKSGQFYFLRLAFALACAASETRLYSAVQRSINPRVAIFFLMVTVTSAGMFHASTAYLPSTFAMYCTMNGIAAFMNWQGGLRTAQGIMWFGIGATVGWPFAGVLVAPFIAEELLYASMTGQGIETITRFVYGAVRSLLVLVRIKGVTFHNLLAHVFFRLFKYVSIRSSIVRLLSCLGILLPTISSAVPERVLISMAPNHGTSTFATYSSISICGLLLPSLPSH